MSIIETLTNELVQQNNQISYATAKQWVELFWEDFEATNAKAGEYHGEKMAEKVVRQWITNYGKYLHMYEPTNPKFRSMMKGNDHLQH